MWHADINMTMSRYSHALIGQELDALAALPDLSAPQAEAARDTGTAGPEPGAARLARCLALPMEDLEQRQNDEAYLSRPGGGAYSGPDDRG